MQEHKNIEDNTKCSPFPVELDCILLLPSHHAAPAFMGMILIAMAVPILYKRTHVMSINLLRVWHKLPRYFVIAFLTSTKKCVEALQSE